MYGYPQLNPFSGNPYAPQVQPDLQRQEVVKVNGENGANAINLAPNSSLLALDMSGLMVWLVTTDGAGYKTATPYDITPHQMPKHPDYTDLSARLEALENRMEELSHGYSGNTAATAEKPSRLDAK